MMFNQGPIRRFYSTVRLSQLLLVVALFVSQGYCDDVVTVDLHPTQRTVSSMVRYERPTRIPLSKKSQDRLKAEPEYQSDSPLYGTMKLGGRDKSITVVLDEVDDRTPRLFIDHNRDGNLTNDGLAMWSKSSDSTFGSTIVHIDLNYGGGTVPFAFQVYRLKDRLVALYHRNTAREGHFRFDGNDYTIVLLDENADGRFDDRANGALLVDLDNDGKLSNAHDSAEYNGLGDAINIHGQVWEVAALARDGSSLTLRESEAEVQMKHYLCPGCTAPDFSAKRLNGETLDLTPASVKGEHVLVHFWASTSDACRREYATLRRLHAQYKEHGLRVIGVNLDVDREKAAQTAKEHLLDYPHVFDGKGWKNTVASQYRVHALPQTYLLDKDLRIVARDLRGPELQERVSQLLGPVDPRAAAEAEKALANDLRRHVDTLIPLLAERDYRKRSDTVKRLGELGSDAAPLLLEHLEMARWDTRNAIVDVIGQMKSPAVIPGLMRRLEDARLQRSQRSAYERIMRTMRDESRRAVNDLVQHQHPSVRESGIRLLWGYSDAQALDCLRAALKDPSPSVRIHAAFGLARRQDAAALPVLRDAVQESDVQLRALAISGVGHYDARSALPILSSLQASNDRMVRSSAINALGRIKDSRATQMILELVISDASLTHSAIWAWQRQRTSDAASAIVRLSRGNDNRSFRSTMINALAGFKEREATEAIVELVTRDDSLRDAAIAALARQDTPDAARALRDSLEDDDLRSRMQIQSALRRMRIPEASQILEQSSAPGRSDLAKARPQRPSPGDSPGPANPLTPQQLERWRETAEDFSDALDLNPENAHLYPARANAFVYLRQYDKAVAVFDEFYSQRQVNEQRFTEWIPQSAMRRHLDANKGNGRWITAAEGRWQDGATEFRVRHELAPQHRAYTWCWWYNLEEAGLAQTFEKCTREGMSLVHCQSFKGSDGRPRYQVVWQRLHGL